MIQRIQSVFLAIAVILDGAFFFNNLYTQAMADPQVWIGISFTVFIALAGLASLGSIFLYSNRKFQIRCVSVTIVLQLIAFGYSVGILISLGGFGIYLWNEAIGAAMLLVALIADVRARKKIKDDEDLVKSMDRIR